MRTAEGPLELRRRADDWLIVVGGRVLMTSAARRSEEALARMGCAGAKRALVAGLGMGFTLRAALDAVGPGGIVDVVEISEPVVRWCRGPLAAATGGAIDDPRVRVTVGDVTRVIRDAPDGAWDAIALDLYEGPYERRGAFGDAALRQARRALADGGRYAVWSEDEAPDFPGRLAQAGFDARIEKIAGQGGRRHLIYVGVATDAEGRRPTRRDEPSPSSPSRRRV